MKHSSYSAAPSPPPSHSYVLGLELDIDLPPPRGTFVHYDFLKLHYIIHKMKDYSPLRVAAFKVYHHVIYVIPSKK